MENRRHPGGSSFGPRSRMSTRSKVANGTKIERKSRFRSKRMNQIAKDVKKHEAYMPRIMRNTNDRSGIGVTNSAHMNSGKKTYESDNKDQDGSIVSSQANKVSLNNRRGGQSSDASIALGNGASSSKNVIPLRKRENPTPLPSNAGSNTKLKHQKQSLGIVHNLNITRRSYSIDSKVMPKEAHKAKNVDAWINDGDTLVSMANGPSSDSPRQNIKVNEDSDISKSLKGKNVLEGSNIPLASEHLVPNNYYSNEYTMRHDEVVNVNETETKTHIRVLHAIHDDNHKQEEIMKADGARSSSSLLNSDKLMEESARNLEKFSSTLLGKDLSKASCIDDKNCAIESSMDVVQSGFKETCLEMHKKDEPSRYAGKINNSKRKIEPLRDDGCTRVVQLDNLTCMTIKRRRYIPIVEDEDEDGGCNKNLMGVDGTSGLTPHVDIMKDCVEQQCDYCSKPINEPTWSGIFKIDGKEYILAGHLSTKSCEKVWKLSKLLPPLVEMERVSRLVVWPMTWKSSKSSSNNIGLYFLPHNMRQDEELDQLVKEVKENDLVLRAVINEAEMLIFPSTLLTKRYQTFQAKHYLWAVFKPRGDKGVLAELLSGTGHSAQEEARIK